MSEIASSNREAQILKEKRKQILRTRGKSQEYGQMAFFNTKSYQSLSSGFKQVEHYSPQNYFDKQKQMQNLRLKNKSCCQQIENLHAHISKLEQYIQIQIFDKNQSNKKIDQSQSYNNKFFNFFNENPRKRQNFSGEKDRIKQILQSTQINLNSSSIPSLEPTSLKNSLSKEKMHIRIKEANSGSISKRKLLKIPEEPQKQLKKAKSESQIQDIDNNYKKNFVLSNQNEVRNLYHEIDRLKKNILKLQKANHNLTKQCSLLRLSHKHKKGLTERKSGGQGALVEQNQSLKKKINKYEKLIEKQQKEMERIILLCEEDIQTKNKQISKIELSHTLKQNKMEKTIQNLMEKNQKLNEKIKNREQKLRNFEQKNKTLLFNIQTLQKQLEKKQDLNFNLYQKLQELQKNNIGLQRQQNSLKNTIVKLEKNQWNNMISTKNFMEDSSSDGSERILIINGKKYTQSGNIMFDTQF